MPISISLPTVDVQTRPRITVFGVGGAGGNAVNNMIRANLEGVEFVVANTDAQALQGNLATKRLQLGSTITRGLGAGSRPDVGRAAAEEQLEEILSHLDGTNMAFITGGMGGGTGTGAAPVIARAAREQGILTVGVVTKPFNFEGAHRMRVAEQGIQELASFVDTLIIIPNQNLFRIANERTTFADAFKMADDVLHAGVRGVTDLMVMPGLINLDFADIRTVMTEMGKAMMGTGEGIGDRRAIDAAEAAISNPLLDDVSMKGARGVLINITGGYDMTLFEVDEAANRIRDEVDPEANIIFGSTFDQNMDGKMRVSVVATGIDNAAMQPRPVQQPQLQVVAGRTVEQKRGFGPAPAPVREVARSTTHSFANLTPAPVAPAPQVPAAVSAQMGSAQPAMASHGSAAVAVTTAAYAQAVAETATDSAAPAPAASAERLESRPAASAQGQGGSSLSSAPQGHGPVSAGNASAMPRAERRESGFIPPRPVDTGPRASQITPDRFHPPAQAAPEVRKAGLFQRMFGMAGEPARPAVSPSHSSHTSHGNHASAPAAHGTPAQRPQAVAPQPGPVALEPRGKSASSEDDHLDIPAFLRRQAN
jgi:cell division protein FtsZ